MCAHATRRGRAQHKIRKLKGVVAMTSIPEMAVTQADRIPRALEEGPELDPGVANADAQIAILRRKNLIAKQAIALLSAEVRELKGQGRQAAA
jgi:hypothetical protein